MLMTDPALACTVHKRCQLLETGLLAQRKGLWESIAKSYKYRGCTGHAQLVRQLRILVHLIGVARTFQQLGVGHFHLFSKDARRAVAELACAGDFKQSVMRVPERTGPQGFRALSEFSGKRRIAGTDDRRKSIFKARQSFYHIFFRSACQYELCNAGSVHRESLQMPQWSPAHRDGPAQIHRLTAVPAGSRSSQRHQW